MTLRDLPLAMLATVLALSAVGCSLVLDLPADCRIEDCGGFQCNDEGTGCLFECAGDFECTDGFVCSNAVCLATGCAADAPPASLLPGSDVQNMTMLWNGADLGTVAITDSGLSFRRFGKDGQPTGQPLVLDLPAAQPAQPSIVWTGDVWGVAWKSRGTDGQEAGQEKLRFAVIDVGDTFDVDPVTLWITTPDFVNNIIEKSVDDPSIVWDAEANRFAIVWSTRIDVGDLYLLSVGKDGSDLDGNDPDEIPHEAAARLTITAFDSVAPKVAVRSEGVYDVVFREGAASVNVVLRTVDNDGDRRGGDVNISATEGRADRHAVAPITTGLAVAFSEVVGGGSETFRAQIKRDRGIAGEQKLIIDRGFETATDATISAALTGEYAAVFVADKDRRLEVYMARFKDNGARIGAPFSLSEQISRGPIHPVVAATDSGYFVVYRETEGADAGINMARHWTCSPP